MDNQQKSLCIIDRFEGEWAVVEYEGKHTFNIPRSLLPLNADEGDVLNFELTVDIVETQKRREEISALTKNIFIDE